MAFRGFGKNSGPSTPPRAQTPFGNFARPPSPSSPLPVLPRSSIDYRDLDASEGISSPPLDSSLPFPGAHRSSEPPLRWGDVKTSSFKDHGAQYQRPSTLLPQVASRNPRAGTPAKAAEFPSIKRTNSSYSQSRNEISNISRSVMDGPLDSSSNKSYLVPYGARSPPLVFQNNHYVAGQHPHSKEVQQHPFSPVWVNQSQLSSRNTNPPAQEAISSVFTTGSTYQSVPMFQTKHADGPLPKRTRSPTPPSTTWVSPENTRPEGHKRSLIHYRDLDAPEDMSSAPLALESSSSGSESSRPFAGIQKPFPSSMLADPPKSSNDTTLLVQEDMSLALTKRGTYQSGRKLQTEHADVPLLKRTRSPPIPSSNGGFPENPAIVSDSHKRALGFRSQSQSPSSGQASSAEAAVNKPVDFPAVKRTKIPLQSSSDLVSQENLDPAQEIERELHAKAKRLARFKDELSQSAQSHSTAKNQKDTVKRQHLSMSEKQKFSEDPKMDVMVDSVAGNISSDYEGVSSSASIVGLCPDMCPESERAERERKGDLDQYERLDGDRNLTSELLAVKKYNRTAEREPELIRPMPILQKTMDYLLNLLVEPYDDRFLGLYNFLWDRMRAIRMDLRMQHIFNLEAISMLEQMIRLHIIAMHELCEYNKGEGFSEGFDAHLNIEQMNKTSVELFQLYDDHRKKGIHVPSEREFRGYYALLKLDKHPGYKVEPAELSLDLAKMTPEMRQTPEVLFARNVARACRTGNFIAFFRLARRASYLQACLMHAHFSKLRTQALASLHSGLQINQGIPITHIAKWLGMEEEDIGDLLEYYGFSVKDFEEPYMVKENAFGNVNNDFPVKRSKLVERKRSRMIVTDVSFPSLTESYADDEVKEVQLKKDPGPKPMPLQSIVPIRTPQLHDEEMHDLATSLSPKGSVQKSMHKASISPITLDKRTVGVEVQVAPAGPSVPAFFNSSSKHHQGGVEFPQKPKYETAFRNSFGRSMKHDLEATAAITQGIAVTQETAEENRYPIVPLDSVAHTPRPQPLITEEVEDEELAEKVEEDITDDVTSSNYDKGVVEAKLRLILRIWKRRTAKKRKLREHRQFTANAALNLLSLGPPIWQFEVQSGNFGMFNIDHVMSERHQVQERSWSVLNPSAVVATKLVEKNPDAKCLCWKLILCSQEETLHEDSLGQQNEGAVSAAASWLHSKLICTNSDGADDLLVSSPGLAIWRSWIPSQSGDLTCCLSVIKSTTLKGVNKSILGASAVLFLLSERVPLELQKKQLHDLAMLLPSASRLPLLILSGSGKDESDPSDIAKALALDEIDKSRVIMSYITFLKDIEMKSLDGFFSDKHLREGLEWLARQSPPQIVVSRKKTREWVLSHLNTTLEILGEMDTHRAGPNDCISAFNEALEMSMKEVAAAAHANPIGWPCPEINLLEETSDEYKAATWYLPSIGWSSASRTEALISALNDSQLPAMEDDFSWLSRGIHIGDDIGDQKSRLENCLVNYLTEATQMMGTVLAQKEAGIMLQKCTSLELHNTTYHIIPKWVSIFRRIFNWRLMKLNSGEVSSTYLLAQHYSSTPRSGVLDNLESKHISFLPPYVVQPSLDELVEVGCCLWGYGSNHMEHEEVRPWSPMASGGADVPTSNGNAILTEKGPEDNILANYDHSETQKSNEGDLLMYPSKAPKDADKLSELLEKCNIVQNLIDEKLSIYF